MVLVPGQAEQLLADRVQVIANQLGITERTALDRYLPDDVVIALDDLFQGLWSETRRGCP